MEIEQKLDVILDILYDENLLQFKQIPITNFVAQALQNYNIHWSDAEMNFILTLLQDGGYVDINKTDNTMKPLTYSLTTKGIEMKRKGGFERNRCYQLAKQGIIFGGAFVALIVGLLNIYIFFSKESNGNDAVSNQPLEVEIIDTTSVTDTTATMSVTLPKEKAPN